MLLPFSVGYGYQAKSMLQVNNITGQLEMWEREEGNPWQHWRWGTNVDGDQLALNVGSEETLLQVYGIGAWRQGAADASGYHALVATGGMEWDSYGEEGSLALDRGWDESNGAQMVVWQEHGAANQLFKLISVS